MKLEITTNSKVKMFGEWHNVSRIDVCNGNEYFTLNNNVNTVSREFIETNATEICDR